MKRFIIITSCLLIVVFGAFYITYGIGFYIDFHPDAGITVPFRADEKAFARLTQDGSYEHLALRGIDISAGMAGHYASEFFAGKEDYLRWFGYIGEMGANFLRVTTIMDSDFYHALYLYNTSHTQPLYLLQGISVTDYANDNSKDAYGNGFFDKLVRDGKNAVDIIHGKKMISSFEAAGDIYRNDISPWVLGYLVGSEWSSDTIAYTNNSHIRPENFHGKYFYTSPDAEAFEAMLAQVMESMTAYETEKYKMQRPIGFSNDPSNDFLEYEEVYAKQLTKHVRLDAERVLATETMQAGRFAAYRLYDFCDDFTKYLTAAQTEALDPILADLDYSGTYGGYLDLLPAYHNMPVIAAGFGFSSSRGMVRMDIPPFNEREQGENLASLSLELEANDWAGGFISTWQDSWERGTWNTSYSSFPGGNNLWHNLQSDSEGYGLMAFDPGENGRVCVIDGSRDEWDDGDLVHGGDGIAVYAKYDEEGLYLLVEKSGLSPSDDIFLPLDVSPKVGAYASTQPPLTFSRAVDFILCLTGEDDSCLLVQERFDSTRQRFLTDITGEDPFIRFPEKNSPVFKPVYMTTANPLIVDVITAETRKLKRNKTWETGKLVHGNGDPASPQYNSLADFCYGEGLVEVRLPWLLLNFYDPPTMKVHDDYYEKYGVQGTSIQSIYVGATESAEAVPMSKIPIKGWRMKATSHERLKQSYYIVKKGWLGE